MRPTHRCQYSCCDSALLLKSKHTFSASECRGTVIDRCQSITRKLPSLFLTRDRMTQYSTQHPAQTQHCQQPLNVDLHHEHIRQGVENNWLKIKHLNWCVKMIAHFIQLMREDKGGLKRGGTDTEHAHPGSWVQEDCPYSWAGKSHWETSSVDLQSPPRRHQPGRGRSLWTGLRSAPWRPRVHSVGPL